jgi:uncharacterized protein YwgA
MTKYQLAKLILLAGGLKSRKRVQKTAYLLQAAGCPLGLDFRLHYYGPYSADLAEMLDQTTAAGILEETSQQTTLGTQYDYSFNEAIRGHLEAFEQTGDGQGAKHHMESYGALLQTLCRTRPRVLELASTIAMFHKAGHGWDEAVEETAGFKNEPSTSITMREARELACALASSQNSRKAHPIASRAGRP